MLAFEDLGELLMQGVVVQRSIGGALPYPQRQLRGALRSQVLRHPLSSGGRI
jgi:hypothetical protein